VHAREAPPGPGSSGGRTGSLTQPACHELHDCQVGKVAGILHTQEEQGGTYITWRIGT
jgi:hypothetical protein